MGKKRRKKKNEKDMIKWRQNGKKMVIKMAKKWRSKLQHGEKRPKKDQKNTKKRR